MARTYIPTLLNITKRLCVYITTYEVTIRKYLTTQDQEDALEALSLACSAFLILVEEDVQP
jgi:hypothetical protein